MSTSDVIKKSVLEAFGQTDPAKIAIGLLVSLVMGLFICCVYKRFYTWSTRAALP